MSVHHCIYWRIALELVDKIHQLLFIRRFGAIGNVNQIIVRALRLWNVFSFLHVFLPLFH